MIETSSAQGVFRRGITGWWSVMLMVAGCSAAATGAPMIDGGRPGDVRTSCERLQARGSLLGCEPRISPEQAERVCGAVVETAVGCEANAGAYLDCAATGGGCASDSQLRCAADWEGWERCVDATDADVCYEYCTESHRAGCGLASPECLGECLSLRTIAAAAGCTSELRAFEACLGALPDVCERSSCEEARLAAVRCEGG